MIVRVLMFAGARDAVGAPQVEVQLPAQATVGDLKQALADQFPVLQMWLLSSSIAVDHRYAPGDSLVIDATNEIALIPPVSGG